MRIQILSDIHLEFGQFFPKQTGADLMVLAGDIIPVKNLGLPYVKPFFEFVNNNYEKTFMVFGNHEYYKESIVHGIPKFRKWLSVNNFNNITVLQNETVNYKGIDFIGATLWTDFDRNNFAVMQFAKTAINDFRLIKNKDWGKITPQEIYMENQVSENFIEKSLMKFGSNSVVITHHAPCQLSVNEKYKNDIIMNSLYFSEYSNMILSNQPKLWIHGHMHDSVDYNLDQTRVICNPRGYFGYETNPYFVDDFVAII